MAMLCASGLATMSELLAYRGPWSFKLLSLMLPRAVELEMKAANMNFNATLAAVGSLFSKDAAKTWQSAMSATQKSVNAAVANAGGEDVRPAENAKDIEDLIKVGKKLSGMSGKGEGPIGPAGPTRVHRK